MNKRASLNKNKDILGGKKQGNPPNKDRKDMVLFPDQKVPAGIASDHRPGIADRRSQGIALSPRTKVRS